MIKPLKNLKNALPILSSKGLDSLKFRMPKWQAYRYLSIVFLKEEKEHGIAKVEKIRKNLFVHRGLDSLEMI